MSVAATCVVLGTTSAVAQGRARAERTVEGHLLLSHGDKAQPLVGPWVTLHRVGRDSAGPVDSTRTAAGGAFRLQYRPWGDTAAVYFVSSRYAGIAYFSSRLTAETTGPGDADLTVYDTTSLAAPITVASRHIIVSAPDSLGSRQIVEVYVLLNGSGLTRVAGPASAATFEARVPDGAYGMRAGEGDIPAQAMAFGNGRMTIAAPIAPGTKRISYTYQLHASGAEMAFPALSPSDVLEVMVEDSAGVATGPNLHEEAAVVVSGRTFRRFIGHDVSASGVVRVRASAAASLGNDSARTLAVIAAAVAMIGALTAAMRRGSAPDGVAPEGVALAPPGRAD